MYEVRCCKVVKINIQEYESDIDLSVILLGDAKIILGTV